MHILPTMLPANLQSTERSTNHRMARQEGQPGSWTPIRLVLPSLLICLILLQCFSIDPPSYTSYVRNQIEAIASVQTAVFANCGSASSLHTHVSLYANYPHLFMDKWFAGAPPYPRLVHDFQGYGVSNYCLPLLTTRALAAIQLIELGYLGC